MSFFGTNHSEKTETKPCFAYICDESDQGSDYLPTEENDLINCRCFWIKNLDKKRFPWKRNAKHNYIKKDFPAHPPTSYIAALGMSSDWPQSNQYSPRKQLWKKDAIKKHSNLTNQVLTFHTRIMKYIKRFPILQAFEGALDGRNQ